MNVNDFTTEEWTEITEDCLNLDDFKEKVLTNLEDVREAWSRHVKEEIERTGISQTKFGELCGVSRTTICERWIKKGAIPADRETFIRFGFAVGYSLEEMNSFLVRFGKFSELYSKNVEDCIYIFVLKSKELPHTFATCEMIAKKVGLVFGKRDDATIDDNKVGLFSTEETDKELSFVHSIKELEEYLVEHKEQFQYKYDGFYSYVKQFVKLNNEEIAAIRNDEDLVDGAKLLGDASSRKMNINSRNAFNQNMFTSSSFRQYLEDVYHNRVIPKRREIVKIGLILNMNYRQLNQLLDYVHMEPLCGKSPTESALIYALLDAEYRKLIIYGDTTLIDHVEEILEGLNISGVDVELSKM